MQLKKKRDQIDSVITKATFYNEDAITGAEKHIPAGSVDLVVTDPPYGIEGDKLHRHYNRNEEYVIDGYHEIGSNDYAKFSREWILQAERVLKPGGSMFIVSGYTNLLDILQALKETSLTEVNHIIWKYNFGVNTSRKFVSSHYHILYYEKPGGRRTFNLHARYGVGERTPDDRSMLYADLEDVWIINREYKPGKVKNKNELPFELLAKIIQYCSREGDVVCDFFLGSFSTAKVARGLNRVPVGFEINGNAFEYQVSRVEEIEPGSMLGRVKTGMNDDPENKGKSWLPEEVERLMIRFEGLVGAGMTRQAAIAELCGEFGRGRFSISNVIKKHGGA
jgi:site-specific DNA-methyltransferase (adenine-specific)